MTTVTVPSLLLEGSWISPIHMHGGETKSLVDIIYSERDNIFPGYYTARFELLLAQDWENPLNVNLVLISNKYNAWCLLLVEPSKDVDLESLEANLQTVSMQRFGSREALYLERQIAMIDGSRLALLMEEQPHLVVITDDPHNKWSEKFSKFDFQVSVMTVEPFQHGDNYVLRVNGSYPNREGATVVGICNDYPSLPTSLMVTWCSTLPRPEAGALEITYGGKPTHWQVWHGNPDLVLVPLGSSPLREKPPFELFQEMDGGYSLRKSTESTNSP